MVIQTLIDASTCYLCLPGVSQADAVELALLDAISQNTIVVGGGSGLAGVGSPEGIITASPGTTYIDTSGQTFWVKRTGAGNTGWVQLI